MITLVVVSVILFPMYAFMRYANIPAYGSTCTSSDFVSALTLVTADDVKCLATEGILRV